MCVYNCIIDELAQNKSGALARRLGVCYSRRRSAQVKWSQGHPVMSETSTVVGPRLSKADLFRTANTQTIMIQGDSVQLGTIISKCLDGSASESQAVDNALNFVNDVRASLNEIHHALACILLDPLLRDRPHIYDAHGVGYTYRGCESRGIRIANTSGEFQHVIRIVKLVNGGFVAEKDTGPAESFTFHQHDGTTNGVTSDPDV